MSLKIQDKTGQTIMELKDDDNSPVDKEVKQVEKPVKVVVEEEEKGEVE